MIFEIVEVLLLLFFGYASLYTFLFSFSGRLFKSKARPNNETAARILLLIPGYKEDNVIVEVAKQAISHDYSKNKFDVMVIADSFNQLTLDKLSGIEDLIVLEVQFENSTKVKSLRAAISSLSKNYDFVVILDADNLMKPGFLKEMNNLYQMGEKAIQAKRIARNSNSSIAILDGLSEEINNHIYRRGADVLNLSCPFIGSGMAVDFKLFCTLIDDMDAVGGFDRDMEVRLLKKGIKVKYTENGVVLDEKVSDTSGFSNQRRRWMSSQWIYLIKHLPGGLLRLVKGEFAYFNSAIARNILLPRLINLGFMTIFTIISVLLLGINKVTSVLWLTLLLIFILSNIMAIPKHYLNKRLLFALLLLPKMFLLLSLNLFKLRGADTKFIHTPHYGKDDQ